MKNNVTCALSILWFLIDCGSLYAGTPASSIDTSTSSMFRGASIIEENCPKVEYSSAFMECVDSKKAIPDLGWCYNEEFQLWDKKLNLSYQELLNALKPENTRYLKKEDLLEEARRLKDSQRLWVKFRDANCEFMQDEPTGIAEVSKTQCLLEMTVLRTFELNRMLPQK